MAVVMQRLYWLHLMQPKGWPDETNFIITDNQRMMRWIVDGWVSKMPTFIGKAGLQHMSWLNLDSVHKTPGDLKTEYRETPARFRCDAGNDLAGHGAADTG